MDRLLSLPDDIGRAATSSHAGALEGPAGRILLLASNFPPVCGGSAAVYGNLARCAGGRIVVLAPTHSYADGRELEGWREHDRHAAYKVVRRGQLRSPLRAERCRRPLGRLAANARDLGLRIETARAVFRLLRAERARTVCVGELLAGGWLLGVLRWIPWIRTVAYVHGEEITTADPCDPRGRHVRRALRRADRVVVVSRFSQGAAARLLGPAGRRKLFLIPNGVDRRRFRPGARRADLVDRYGLEGAFVFVSICRLVEKKGVDNAIRAFALVARAHPDCRLLVVGAGPYAPELHRLAEASGDGGVIFAGEVAEEELVDHYRLGDVFVMPNRALENGDTEGFGLVFLEANACGLPAIAGSDGGSTDAVEHEVNGLVVDGRSVKQIADAMLRLREDAGLRARLAREGLARAAANDWGDRTKAFLEVCLEPRPKL
jgi:phosphatidylinositol alpha-1,6-mannosyltransferase